MLNSRFIRFRYLIILTSFLLAVGVMVPGTSFAKSWSIVPSPNQSSNNDFLSAVAAVSASNIWAVGAYFTSSGNPQTLIEQWNGSSWSIVPSPNPQGAFGVYLNSVAVVSANNVWAVGYYFNSTGVNRTLIEQWNGSSWSIVASPNQGSIGSMLNGVVAVSANNIWAVGYYSNSSTGSNQTLIEHWNGSSWSIVPSPNQGTLNNMLNGVATVPGNANNIWAVGDYGSSKPSGNQTLIEHWNGTSWSIVASPNQDSIDNVLNGVTVVSTSNIWAVGDYINRSSGTDYTLIEQWNGTSWNIVSSPNVGSLDNVLLGVARVPDSSNMWAVGYDAPNNIAMTSTLIEYFG